MNQKNTAQEMRRNIGNVSANYSLFCATCNLLAALDTKIRDQNGNPLKIGSYGCAFKQTGIEFSFTSPADIPLPRLHAFLVEFQKQNPGICSYGAAWSTNGTPIYPFVFYLRAEGIEEFLKAPSALQAQYMTDFLRHYDGILRIEAAQAALPSNVVSSYDQALARAETINAHPPEKHLKGLDTFPEIKGKLERWYKAIPIEDRAELAIAIEQAREMPITLRNTPFFDPKVRVHVISLGEILANHFGIEKVPVPFHDRAHLDQTKHLLLEIQQFLVHHIESEMPNQVAVVRDRYQDSLQVGERPTAANTPRRREYELPKKDGDRRHGDRRQSLALGEQVAAKEDKNEGHAR